MSIADKRLQVIFTPPACHMYTFEKNNYSEYKVLNINHDEDIDRLKFWNIFLPSIL